MAFDVLGTFILACARFKLHALNDVIAEVILADKPDKVLWLQRSKS